MHSLCNLKLRMQESGETELMTCDEGCAEGPVVDRIDQPRRNHHLFGDHVLCATVRTVFIERCSRVPHKASGCHCVRYVWSSLQSTGDGLSSMKKLIV